MILAAGRAVVPGPGEARYAWALALIAALARLIPGALVTGTEDVGLSWEMAQSVVEGGNPYVDALAAWPPLWPALAALAVRFAALLSLPSHLAIKLWPIAADVAIALTLFSWKRISEPPRAAFRFALLWALNPVSIYITAIHGNFDSLPALALLMALLFARAEGRATRGAAWWLALGAALKTWPLFALPAILDRRRVGASLRCAAIAIVPSAALIFLLWLRTPEVIVEKVLRYRGAAGWWGTTGLASLLGIDAGWAPSALFYGAMAATALLFLSDRDPASTALALLVAFLAFAHGFGAQYLLWPVAVGLLASRRVTIAYSAIAAVTLVIEGTMRPWTGELGQHLTAVPTHLFHTAYGGARDREITTLVRMPVWLFVAGWWGALALDRVRTLLRASRIRRDSERAARAPL
ncbi:MAG TPA: hypothetical protein VLV48_05475 [Thermoanaerobaculia bacterium]|nr:hypothetical protein [Thermoanaerobaculia bacterium]